MLQWHLPFLPTNLQLGFTTVPSVHNYGLLPLMLPENTRHATGLASTF